MSVLARLATRPHALGVALGTLLLAAGVMAAQPASSSAVPTAQTSSQSSAASAKGAAQVQAKKRQGSLMVMGDSISGIFNDNKGSPRQGFWSMLADQVGAKPHVVAQGGAGFVRKGLVRCKGLNFMGQLSRPSVAQLVTNADVFIIEGGRNDTRVCTGHGHNAPLPIAELRKGVDVFMDKVEELRGSTDDCTIVVTPWGPKGTDVRAQITPVIRKAARQHGFTFVDTTSLLTKATTIEDGVHPTRAGNLAMTRAIMARSYAEACFY